MDKIVLKFFADVMYLKGVLCFEELEDIMEACIPEDLDDIFENMVRGNYNAYVRGDFTYDFRE